MTYKYISGSLWWEVRNDQVLINLFRMYLRSYFNKHQFLSEYLPPIPRGCLKGLHAIMKWTSYRSVRRRARREPWRSQQAGIISCYYWTNMTSLRNVWKGKYQKETFFRGRWALCWSTRNWSWARLTIGRDYYNRIMTCWWDATVNERRW